MLEAETGMGGEEKDRALQAEDTQQHQTPLRGVPFPLHCGKRELLSNTPVTHTKPPFRCGQLFLALEKNTIHF